MKSPVGDLHALSNSDKLYALIFDKNWPQFLRKNKINFIQTEDETLKNTKKQLNEYFLGKRKTFEISIALIGTEFQVQAWRALQKICFGKTFSYSEQAELIKKPKAVRAIGAANKNNPIAIIVPCHRVVGKSGALTGYAGGLLAKKKLLKIEGIHFS